MGVGSEEHALWSERRPKIQGGEGEKGEKPWVGVREDCNTRPYLAPHSPHTRPASPWAWSWPLPLRETSWRGPHPTFTGSKRLKLRGRERKKTYCLPVFLELLRVGGHCLEKFLALSYFSSYFYYLNLSLLVIVLLVEY